MREKIIIKPQHYPECETCPIAETKIQRALNAGASRVKVRCNQLPKGKVKMAGQYESHSYRINDEGNWQPIKTVKTPLPRTTISCPSY